VVSCHSKERITLKVRSGGKPVIYIDSPNPINDVHVQLDLAPEWDFTAIYPVVKGSDLSDGGHRVIWDVNVRTGGTLVHAGEEAAYLYWEAVADYNPRSESALPFDPRSRPLPAAHPQAPLAQRQGADRVHHLLAASLAAP
jgi:hypothetical protein